MERPRPDPDPEAAPGPPAADGSVPAAPAADAHAPVPATDPPATPEALPGDAASAPSEGGPPAPAADPTPEPAVPEPQVEFLATPDVEFIATPDVEFTSTPAVPAAPPALSAAVPEPLAPHPLRLHPPPPAPPPRSGRGALLAIAALLSVAMLAFLAAAWPLLAPPAPDVEPGTPVAASDAALAADGAQPTVVPPPPRTTPAPVPTSGTTAAADAGDAPDLRDLSPDYAPPAQPGDHVHRHYAWRFGGLDWSLRMDLPLASYDAYRALERPSRLLVQPDGSLLRQQAYDVFVTDPADDAFVDGLAQRLDAAADAEGYGREERLAFLLAFVQSLPYTSDNVTTGFDEYARYPLETLVDDGGDCEDTSILYASLLRSLGEPTVLLAPPAHMAVGVAAGDATGDATGDADDAAGTYVHDGVAYLYAETTGRGWALGEVPDEYLGAPAETLDLLPKPLFHLEASFGTVRNAKQEVTMEATQTGSGVAQDVRLVADVRRVGGSHYDMKQCGFATVQPGETITCTVWLDLRTVGKGERAQVFTGVYDATHLYDQVRSAIWVPRP